MNTVSLKHSALQWATGFAGTVLTVQGGIATLLGIVLTIATLYKIILDIQIRRISLRKMRLEDTLKDED